MDRWYRGKQRNGPSCSQGNTVMRLGLQLVRQLEPIIVYLHADPLYLLKVHQGASMKEMRMHTGVIK